MIAMLVLVPFLASGHPGKTDPYGGHRCLKDCAEWDLLYNEYHLHDKEGRTVRVAHKKKAPAARKVGTTPAPAAAIELPPPAATAPAVSSAMVAAPVRPPRADDEAELLPWPGALLLLLLFWLLHRRMRSR